MRRGVIRRGVNRGSGGVRGVVRVSGVRSSVRSSEYFIAVL